MISNRALWRRARSLFDDLVELPDDEQHRRLETIGREDPELRTAVERLIVADRGAESALRDYSFGSVEPSRPAVPHANSRDPLGIIGSTVSHFLVTHYLAAGGMGVVYAAEDLQLGRAVALKFPLPHQTLDRGTEERFVNEAKSAGSLDHPNLCTVHEIGESEHGLFLAMPLYPGETLRDRLARDGSLPPAVVLDVVQQVVSGLASAHAAGIVHRDLKPGNVMLLPDGTVKVLDFGLAKMRDANLTKSRAALGTVAYVAPEQIRGAATDARADLWAIGVMLHEMLTGSQPFAGEHEISLLHAVLHQEPPQPSRVKSGLPPGFDQVVGTLLQKDPGDRYQSSAALLDDIGAMQRGAGLARRMPFWHAQRRRSLRRALGPVSALVLTAVVLGGPELAALRERGDPLGAGSSAAADGRPGTREREAYDLYLRGRHQWRLRTQDGFMNALALYQQAIERDPGFALAYSAMADAYVNASNFGYAPLAETLARAEVAASRAIALDSLMAAPRASLGFALASRAAFDSAEAELQRAIALDSGYTWGHHYYSLLHQMRGDPAEALRHNGHARTTDALSLPANANLGIILLQAGDTAAAVRELQRALSLLHDFPLTLHYLGVALASQRRDAEALPLLERAAALAADFPGVLGALALVNTRLGRHDQSDSILSVLQAGAKGSRGRINLGLAYAMLAQVDMALPLLHDAEWDVPSLIELRTDPLLGALRDDARYTAMLLQIMGRDERRDAPTAPPPPPGSPAPTR